MKLTAVIECSKDGFYSIYTEETIPHYGIFGYGNSVAEAKQDMLDVIEEFRTDARAEGKEFPESFEIEYRYDIPSFFNAFSYLNVSAVAKKAGINSSRMRAYKAGLTTASEKTVGKLRTAIKAMSTELGSAAI